MVLLGNSPSTEEYMATAGRSCDREQLRTTVDMAGIIYKAIEPLNPVLEPVKKTINRLCEGLEPWQIVVYSGGTTLVIIALKEFLFQEESLKARMTKTVFSLIKKIPSVRKKIEAEVKKTRQQIEMEIQSTHVGTFVVHLPEQGLSEEDLFKLIDKYKTMNTVDWAKGSCSGTVYSGEAELTQLAAKTYGLYAWANPLHPDVFPDVRRMEAEIVRMCCTMFNGGPETCGVMTSGGTESILLACLCYRNLAYERGIKHPEMLCPVTAHAAFDKAAAFFRIKMVHAPVDPETKVVDVKAMKKLISRRTCMMVVSVPQFAHGTVDPVEEVAALGKRYGVPVHVDACLGGFLIPFMEKAGFKLAPFDFRVDGVTSISADSHKYGFAPKGSSVILYRDAELRKQQCFSQPDWPGGIYATPTIAGSRAGAIIATCWATMMHIGENGYVESTKKIITTTKFIEEGLRNINGIHVVGEPKVSVVAIASKHFNIYRLSDGIRVKGWSLNPLQFPSSIHLCVTYVHTKPGVAQRFLEDVRSSVAEIMKNPQAECGGAAAIYGMAQSIPDRTLVNDMAQLYIDACYSTTQPVRNGQVHSQANGTVHPSD